MTDVDTLERFMGGVRTEWGDVQEAARVTISAARSWQALGDCAPGETHCSCVADLRRRYSQALDLLREPRSRPMRSSDWNDYHHRVAKFLEDG